MTAGNKKSCLGYLDKLVDQYNNTYHHSIGKPLIDADNSNLIEKMWSIHKAPKFKVSDRVRIAKYKNIFSKGYTKN